MIYQDIQRLTALTKECFADDAQPVEALIAVIAQMQTLLNLEPQRNVYLSATINAGPTALLLDVGIADVTTLNLGTLIQKQYDVTQGAKFLRVTPMNTDLDDLPEDGNNPRRQHTYQYHDETLTVEMLAARLILDLKEFMDAELQTRLGNNPELLTSQLPIATAFRAAFPPLLKTGQQPETDTSNEPKGHQ